MAGTVTMKQGNYFHRTIDLQYGCGCDVLRELMNKKLDRMQITLKDHITNNQSVKGSICKLYPRYLTQEQFQLLYPNPNQQNFDISLVTFLLLNGSFALTADERKCVIQLRKIRNNLSHVPKPELQDDVVFNEASNLIINLAKTCGKEFEKKTRLSVNALLKTELVKVVSKAEVVKLRNELYMVVLIEGDDKKQSDQTDTTLLRFNITKWARKFIEVVELDSLLSDLKKEGVVPYKEKVEIEKHFNKAEQCNALIMKITDETNENVWKFCKCVRRNYPDLADLIVNMADDGAYIEANIEAFRVSQIRQTLKNLLKLDENGTISTEALHIAVEDDLGFSVPFPDIETIVGDEFNIKPSGERGSRYYGMVLTDIPINPGSLVPEPFSENKEKTENEIDIHWNDTCEELAEKLYTFVERQKEGYGAAVQEAIINECLSPKNFVRLSKERLQKCLQDYLQGKRLPIGVLDDLVEIQANIQGQFELTKGDNKKQQFCTSLREFDSPPRTIYKLGEIVKPEKGNILVPVHEFRSLQGLDTTPVAFIMKECVRFICACLNTRQNGTIHFGIQSIAENTGKIDGIRLKSMNVDALNSRIESRIDSCFQFYQLALVKRCIRPIQVIKLDDTACVLELDVIPWSWYTDNIFFKIKFPPNGKQTEHVFVYTVDNNPEIVSIPISRLEEAKNIYEDRIKDRKIAEVKATDIQNDEDDRYYFFMQRLTAGAKYITDQYRLIIVCGKISGLENEQTIRKTFESSTENFYKSGAVVLDFDDDARMRKYVEGNSSFYFQVRTTNDDICLKDNPPSKPLWLYCNGNKDLSIQVFNTNEWIQKRMKVVQRVLDDINEIMPRVLVVFFIFESNLTDSPIISVANECMISRFRNQCIVVSDSEVPVSELKAIVLKRETEDEDFEKHFHTTLSWSDASKALKLVTKPLYFEDIHLPCRNGKVAFLTKNSFDKMNITDIEIVSGKQCLETEEMDIEKQRAAKIKAKESFYRGEEVSWNNFHFGDQVCTRDIYSGLLKSVRWKLEKGKNLIEVETILHQPGSGGTTTGKHLIWELSQFKTNPLDKAYRCCIVRQIQESTAEQICSFMFFDEKAPRAAVILLDNFSEESVVQLKANLLEKAYRRHQADDNVFCLLIVIRRVALTYEKKFTDQLMVHKLTKKEQIWFEDKYKELEGTGEIDVSTLISFNVMRKSFNSKYIDELVDHLLQGVKKTEIPVLKCLSLINVFDRDSLVPLSVFDNLISGGHRRYGSTSLADYIHSGPVGLVVPMQMGHIQGIERCPWNANNTDAFNLITRSRSSNSDSWGQEYTGIMIVSQALADSVLNKLLTSEGSPLQKCVEFVLQITKAHAHENNPMSREFVRIVTSLFKTRPYLTEDGDTRTKFSEMIIRFLNSSKIKDIDERNQIVIELMTKCFDISKDAMVGQQLARFYIYLKDYTAAEDIIQKSIKIQPQNSYLRDTFGQIFFSRMELLLSGKDLGTTDVSKIISTAFSAIEKFRDGQTITSEKESGDNTSCYFMEVKTILHLLESFHIFNLYREETEFIDILNGSAIEIPESYSELLEISDFSKLIRNTPSQMHVEQSLRFLEEKDYQLKRRWYTIHTDKDEKLLLKLRERFERFYGNEGEIRSTKFTYGVGLKSLMNANEKDNEAFRKTVDDVQLKLLRGLQNVDKRDLLIYLGHTVISMSSKEKMTCSAVEPMKTDQYQILLQYSDKLLTLEEKSQRPYLEAYLYYTILNWPSEARQGIPKLGGPAKLKNVLDQWNEKFLLNFKNLFKRKPMPPKTYLALGNGPLGYDIVDFRSVEREWRRTTGKTRVYVQDDHVWDKEYAREVLKRHVGTLNGTGTSILFEIRHGHWDYKLDITCLYNSERLSNRQVSFVLLFTWSGPKATDIRGIEDERSFDDEGPSSLDSKDDPASSKTRERRSNSRNGKCKGKRGVAKGSSHKKMPPKHTYTKQ